MIEEFAPAKINLALHITGKREDGYHLLDSLVAFADIGDTLTATPSGKNSLSISGQFSNALQSLAVEDNLVWKAIDTVRNAAGEHGLTLPPLAIHLHKNLPSASGIGGGSSDAAAALRIALSHLPDKTIEQETLNKLALSLGADVPVCLHPQLTRMEGIGEKLSPLACSAPVFIVLVNPNVAVSTGMIFSKLETTDGGPLQTVPELFQDFSELVAWLANTDNHMQNAACALEPVIQTCLNALANTQENNIARMSGSGATCFALYETQQAAESAGVAIQAAHPTWWVRCGQLL